MKKTPLELGRRERQIVETLQQIKEGSVTDVLGGLADPPSYSSVRTMLGILVEKGWVKFRKQGKKYLYSPAASPQKQQRTHLKKLLNLCFGGKPSDAMAALIEMSASELSEQELDALASMIDKAREEKTS